jgi:UDP-N-acetylmuramoyl-tripeptide--D-alanyl-D-alanine ligase
VWADEVSADDLERHSFTIHLEGPDRAPDQAHVELQLVGRHQVGNAVAATTAALCAAMPLSAIAAALSDATAASRWRMEVRQRADDVVVVNDAYNANPDSMLAACETLARMTRRRRTDRPGVQSWAILGQMLELGEVSAHEHEAIGRAVASLQIDHLVAVGTDAPAMVDAARGAGCPDAVVAEDLDTVRAILQPRPGDLVLVKASRAVGLEKVAETLLAARAAAAENGASGAAP